MVRDSQESPIRPLAIFGALGDRNCALLHVGASVPANQQLAAAPMRATNAQIVDLRETSKWENVAFNWKRSGWTTKGEQQRLRRG